MIFLEGLISDPAPIKVSGDVVINPQHFKRVRSYIKALALFHFIESPNSNGSSSALLRTAEQDASQQEEVVPPISKIPAVFPAAAAVTVSLFTTTLSSGFQNPPVRHKNDPESVLNQPWDAPAHLWVSRAGYQAPQGSGILGQVQQRQEKIQL